MDAKTGKSIWKYKNHWSLTRYSATSGDTQWSAPKGERYAWSIYTHDLDGDGVVEIICGTRAGFTEVLSGAGERKWHHVFFWGYPDIFGVVPMPDGSKTMLVNSTISPGSATYRLNADGKELARSAFPSEGTGAWDGMKVIDLELTDVDGSGELIAVLAITGKRNQVAVHDAVAGEHKWSKLLGGEPSGVAAADLDGDGVKEIIVGTMSSWLCAFDIDGKQRWAVVMPDKVLAVAAAGGDLYVQCSDACTYRLNYQGEVIGRYTVKKENSPGWSQHWRFSRCKDFLFIGDRSGLIAPLKL